MLPLGKPKGKRFSGCVLFFTGENQMKMLRKLRRLGFSEAIKAYSIDKTIEVMHAVTPPTLDQPTGSYTTARSGSKVLILAENERGGYSNNDACYIHSDFFERDARRLCAALRHERKLRNQTSRLGGRSRQRYSQGTDAENHLSIQSHRAAPV